MKISEEARTLLKLSERIDSLDDEILALYSKIGKLTQERFVLTTALKEQSKLLKKEINYDKRGKAVERVVANEVGVDW